MRCLILGIMASTTLHIQNGKNNDYLNCASITITIKIMEGKLFNNPYMETTKVDKY